MRLLTNIRTPYVCRLASMLVLLATSAAAQVTPIDSPCVVRGLIRGGGGLGAGYSVELRSERTPNFPAEAFVDPSGSFQIGGVSAGQYLLVVKTQQGSIVHQEFINAGPGMGEVWIHLPERKMERPVGGTVSAKRLQHKVPSKAAKEFSKSVKASENGATQVAIEHLEKAIQIDPEYMEAHNNLGSQYMQLENYEKALTHLEKACELDPGASTPQMNLATVLLLTRRFDGAEKAARRAVDLDPSSSGARFMLALALLELGRDTEEAIQHLQRAASEVPRAHLALAKTYDARGNRQEAASELKLYLSKARPEERQDLQTWLAKLETPAR